MLRQAGIGALLPYRDSLKAQLKQADRAQARFALILGDDELAAGAITVRDLTGSQQVSVPRAEIVGWLRLANEAVATPAKSVTTAN
jgi:histidyl-tRNA synthetase